MTYKHEEIKAERIGESARGRKRPHPEPKRKSRLAELLESGSLEEFEQALIGRGWRRGSPEFDEAVAAFCAVQRSAR